MKGRWVRLAVADEVLSVYARSMLAGALVDIDVPQKD
jgi:hypothetical protein